MLFSIAADERASLQFEDVASALDAGLPITAIGGDPSAGDRVVHTALKACSSPSCVRISNPGRLPNLKSNPEFAFTCEAWAATTLCVTGSPLAGGMR